jgi:site-specific DNA-cytosine methylase
MRVLVACEFSGTVRDAFAAKGHDAWSCDILPTESPGNHYQCDLFEVIDKDWDLIIAHPPCTYLTVTGNRWFKPEYKDRFPTREQDRKDAIDFFMKIANNKCPRIAIENPVGVMSRIYRLFSLTNTDTTKAKRPVYGSRDCPY